jgi:hypothetical protein
VTGTVDVTAPAPVQRVSTLELFFDLVFVFAVTQVSQFLRTQGKEMFSGLVQAITDLASVAVPLVVSAWETFRQPLIQTAQFIINNVIPAITAVTGFLAHHKTVVQSVAIAFGVLFIATKAYAAWQLILVARTKLMAESQILLNAVMDANPILLVVTLLAALAAGRRCGYDGLGLSMFTSPLRTFDRFPALSFTARSMRTVLFPNASARVHMAVPVKAFGGRPDAWIGRSPFPEMKTHEPPTQSPLGSTTSTMKLTWVAWPFTGLGGE